MSDKKILILPGNNDITDSSVIDRYSYIKKISFQNKFIPDIVDYEEELNGNEFNVNNLLKILIPKIDLNDYHILFGLSYGCNVLLRILESQREKLDNDKRICFWGAYPYWIYHKSLVSESIQTKHYLEKQGFRLNPKEAFQQEKPIEEMLNDLNTNGLKINIGWGVFDQISTTAFNNYLATLNSNIILHPIHNETHNIVKHSKKYESFILGI